MVCDCEGWKSLYEKVVQKPTGGGEMLEMMTWNTIVTIFGIACVCLFLNAILNELKKRNKSK
jgi:hypothetical protein